MKLWASSMLTPMSRGASVGKIEVHATEHQRRLGRFDVMHGERFLRLKRPSAQWEGQMIALRTILVNKGHC